MRSENGRGSLTIRDVKEADQGAYTCEAINAKGLVFGIPDGVLTLTQRGSGMDTVIPLFSFRISPQFKEFLQKLSHHPNLPIISYLYFDALYLTLNFFLISGYTSYTAPCLSSSCVILSVLLARQLSRRPLQRGGPLCVLFLCRHLQELPGHWPLPQPD